MYLSIIIILVQTDEDRAPTLEGQVSFNDKMVLDGGKIVWNREYMEQRMLEGQRGSDLALTSIQMVDTKVSSSDVANDLMDLAVQYISEEGLLNLTLDCFGSVGELDSYTLDRLADKTVRLQELSVKWLSD